VKKAAKAPAKKAGATLAKKAAPAKKVAPAKKTAAKPAGKAKTVFCIECGEKNPAIAKFCFNCGTRLAAPEG
jgi:membrane protease subunit (stomatin/prohibitin family)